MILRRIAQHMKQQHWTGVFIELVIVILGVFIGLQASNWNQARESAVRRAAALERLHDESEQDVTFFKKLVDYYRQNGKKKERTARFVHRVGIESIKEAVLS